MVSIKSCFALSLILVAPSLFCESINIYNNTIYTVNVLVDFGESSKKVTKFSRVIAPAKEEKFEIPVLKHSNKGRTSSVEYHLDTITVTVPEEKEPVWKDGKPGSQVVGVKVKRAAKSVVLTQGIFHGPQKTVTFVINANRNLSFINGIGQIDNLAIYRFIQ